MVFVSWEQPMQWIISNHDGKLVFVPETVDYLSKIHQPVVVVAIGGDCRTGKSYLMNSLAGKYGFAVGTYRTVQTQTKGVWLWCIQHAKDSNKVLILIDTEGLDDPAKDNQHQDLMYVSLAIFLSSTFVFNTIGKIDSRLIDELYRSTLLVEQVRIKSKEGDEFQLNDFALPEFVLAVRDFTLKLEIGGRAITPNEYFNRVIKMINGTSSTALTEYEPRNAIKNVFKNRNCFVFTSPVPEHLFAQMTKNNVKEEDLCPEFQRQSDAFCHYVLTHSTTKKLGLSRNLTGRTLQILAEEYVNAFNAGNIPCMKTILNKLVTQHCVVEKSLEIYKHLMEKINYPIDNEALNCAHKAANEEAIKYFDSNVVLDTKHIFLKTYLDDIAEAFGNEVRRNEECSYDKCATVLEELRESIFKENLLRNAYTCAGGYEIYEKDMERIAAEYSKIAAKGVRADVVWKTFLQSQESATAVIKVAIAQLTDKEKELKNSMVQNEITKMEYAEKEAKIKDEYTEKEAKNKDEYHGKAAKIKDEYAEKEAKIKDEYYGKAMAVIEEHSKNEFARREKLVKENNELKQGMVEMKRMVTANVNHCANMEAYGLIKTFPPCRRLRFTDEFADHLFPKRT